MFSKAEPASVLQNEFGYLRGLDYEERVAVETSIYVGWRKRH
jgi:hypothetical protein